MKIVSQKVMINKITWIDKNWDKEGKKIYLNSSKIRKILINNNWYGTDYTYKEFLESLPINILIELYLLYKGLK